MIDCLPRSEKSLTLSGECPALPRLMLAPSLPTMILTLDAKRRLTVPASLAPTQPGDHFKAEFDPEEDAIVFRRIAKQVDWLAVLKACPVKMDALPPRSRQFPKHPKL